MWAMRQGGTQKVQHRFSPSLRALPISPSYLFFPPSTLTTLSKDPKLFAEEKLVIAPKSHNMSPGGGEEKLGWVTAYTSPQTPRCLTRILPPSCCLCDFRTWLCWTAVRLSPSRLCRQHKDGLGQAVPIRTQRAFLPLALSGFVLGDPFLM